MLVTLYNIWNLLPFQRNPPMLVNDLFEDIKDGVMLIALLEVLSGQKLVRTFFLLNIQDSCITSVGYNFLKSFCISILWKNLLLHRRISFSTSGLSAYKALLQIITGMLDYMNFYYFCHVAHKNFLFVLVFAVHLGFAALTQSRSKLQVIFMHLGKKKRLSLLNLWLWLKKTSYKLLRFHGGLYPFALTVALLL